MHPMRLRALVAALLLFAATARADFRELREVPLDPAIATKLRHAMAAPSPSFACMRQLS